MELKWLEDFICVAEKGNFSNAAETRHITQSALSRRIKSLELWIGAELLDRSSHPISLTSQGEEFFEIALNIVQQSRAAQRAASESLLIAKTGVRVACLHTLALYFVPNLFAGLRRDIGPFEISVVAETRTIEEYLASLTNGNSDFFICYSHPSVTFDINPEHFPSIVIDRDRMVPFHRDRGKLQALEDDSRDAIPYLEYSATSFMSHVVGSVIEKASFSPRLRPLYRASLAESLYTAAVNGLGVAWLPASLIVDERNSPSDGKYDGPWQTSIDLKVFRSAGNDRRIVGQIWSELMRKQRV